MQRIVFCPFESMIDDASLIAKDLGLPIQVGHTDKTKNIDFNSSKISIIRVPEYKNILFLQDLKLGFHQKIQYLNEFYFLKNNIQCFIEDIKIEPLYAESHKVKYIFLPESRGRFSGKIIHHDQIVEFNFVVN